MGLGHHTETRLDRISGDSDLIRFEYHYRSYNVHARERYSGLPCAGVPHQALGEVIAAPVPTVTAAKKPKVSISKKFSRSEGLYSNYFLV